jgi:membrane-associated protease RseP (regulator of RpoE activity)
MPLSETFAADPTAALQRAVADLFALEAVLLDPHQVGAVHLYGHFLADSAEAYSIVSQRFRSLGYTPVFREEKGRQVITALPGQLPTSRPNLRLAGILLAVTVASTLFAGMEWRAGRPLLENILSGLPFAVTLLAILLAHEMGHYLVSRRLGIPTTLPYFIPMPISPLGTMGAFIQMKAPPQNRRHLLAVGLAGPVAGLIVALPLLIAGLSMAQTEKSIDFCRRIQQEVGPDQQGIYIMEGNSILYSLAKAARFGYFVPDCAPGSPKTPLDILSAAVTGCPPCTGEDVTIPAVAFAAWAGILVTGLNLIPAGTLDGGHVAYALLGKKARYLTWGLIGAMVLLGFLWTGWFLWAGLIALVGRRPAVPLDDVTRLKPWQVVVAGLVMVLFLLTFSPIPMQAIPVILPTP